MEESIDFDNESLAGFQAIENAAAGTESIKVLVRIRPLNETEKNVDGENSSLMITSPQSLTIKTYDNRKTYNCSYDTVLGPSASQAQVYDTVKDCTLSVMQGVNSTIFAYGQTGSGKTHSMYGPPNYVSNQLRETEMLGVIPRAIHHIFELARNPKIIQFQVHCSFVQIYNENLFDMLRDSSMNTPLTIREDSYTKEIYVQGLSEYNVKSVTDTLQLLKIAEDNRAIRETHMNQFSSRSHSIFTINIEQKCVAPDGGEISLRSKFNLVDLAGSEKWDLSKDLRDAHIQEMNNINLSLHTLGKCISSLAKASRKKQKEFLFEKQQQQQQQQQQNDNKSANSLEKSFNSSVKVNRNELSTASTREKVIHVPFRESKLTRLLQDSLGGNAKTLLIATISPAKVNADESVSTLKFADRAKQVMVTATANESRPVDHALVKRLQEEVSLWKTIMRKFISFNGIDSIQSFLNLSTSNPPQQFPESFLNEQEQILTNSLLKELNMNALRKSSEHFLPAVRQSNNGGSLLPGSNNSGNNSVHGLSFQGSLSISTSMDNGSLPNKNGNQDKPVPFKQQYSEEELQGIINNGSISGKMSPVSLSYQQHQLLQQEEVAGGGLEYVISLEKALNKEQIHAQHLSKKNETLIKEIEELKFLNMQMSMAQQQQQHQHQQSSQSFAQSFYPQQSQSSYPLPSSTNNNNNNNGYSDRPFSSQQANSGRGGSGNNGAGFDIQPHLSLLLTISDTLSSIDEKYSHSFQFHESIQKIIKKFFKFQIEEEEMKNELNSIFDSVKSLKSSFAPQSLKENAEALQKLIEEIRRFQPSSSSTPYPAAASTPVNFDSGSNSFGNNQGNKKMKPKPRSLPHLDNHPRVEDFEMDPDAEDEAPSRGMSRKSQQGPQGSGTSNGGAGITFRVRGAGPPGQAPSTNQSQDGSVGWLNPSQIEEDEEERMKEELKKAKKKQKQREKLQQWAREKEERQQQELKAQEEERKAMQEAELAREAKRKEYVQKQKQKLSSYQDRLKSEKEKIQELISLGIDPKSLNL